MVCGHSENQISGCLCKLNEKRQLLQLWACYEKRQLSGEVHYRDGQRRWCIEDIIAWTRLKIWSINQSFIWIWQPSCSTH